MPNSRQTSVIASPSSSRATNRRRSSITEHSFRGINTSRRKAKSVTHVSGTICHLCLRLDTVNEALTGAREAAAYFLALTFEAIDHSTIRNTSLIQTSLPEFQWLRAGRWHDQGS